MPRVRVEDYEDFEDDMELDIDDDDPRDRAGRKISPTRKREDQEWEERRRDAWRRRNREE